MSEQEGHSVFYIVYVALIVALGGFLMGFDASVISGVVGFIEPEFQLSKIELGWGVASLTLTATFSMMVAGPLSDRFGRKRILSLAAILFALSAIASALAPNFATLVAARMLGGFGVGAALIIAPMYIAEISPARLRGRMVSFNQLNIVIGISTAFFTNYLILRLGQSETSLATSLNFSEFGWRWMLGIEAVPALLYFVLLRFVPESPRWLLMQGQSESALAVMTKASGEKQALSDLQAIHSSINADGRQLNRASAVADLFSPAMKLVMVVGVSIAVLQQITGINSVFFYAPMIFEQSGIGTDASFMQAILVGLTNLMFTLVAIALIDRIGRKPLLVFGVAGIAVCMFILAYGFNSATYSLSDSAVQNLPKELDRGSLSAVLGVVYDSDLSFKAAMLSTIGEQQFQSYEASIISAAVKMNPTLILIGILGFVACFAVSLGPVMWVLFSELFPNRIRGMAISFVGLVNSAVSFLVQLVFPWELANLGSSATFAIYGVFALIGLFLIIQLLPETKGKSLEELEQILVK